MASEIGGGNDNNDLSGGGKRRFGEFSKVYARKKRRRAELNDNSAAAGEAVAAVASGDAEPAVPTSPAKSRIRSENNVVQTSQEESLAGQDGNFVGPKKQQPVVLVSEGESASCGGVRVSEECKDSEEEAVPHGGQELLPAGGQEDLPVPQPSDGREAEAGEEPMLSRAEEAVSQLQTCNGQEAVSNAGQELSSAGNDQGLRWLQPTGGEEPLLNGKGDLASDGGQEVVSNGGEEPQPSGGRADVSNSREELEPSGGQADVSNSREGLEPSGGQADISDSREELQLLPNGSEKPQIGVGELSAPSDGEGPHDMPVNSLAVPVSANGNGVLKPVIARVEDRVRLNLSEPTSKDEIRGLKRKLEDELDCVRSVAKKLESMELQVTAYSANNINNNASYVGSGVGNFVGYNQPQLKRVNSVVGSVGHPGTRPFRHLSVSVMENNHGVAEFVEKEKRTPKANQYYRNSEFLLGKDRLPPESNKKMKPNGAGKKHGGEAEYGFGYGFGVDKNRDKVFKSCNNLLQRLMKHKHGWVFNEPVDAQKLGIPDYHDIIRHPMDLGTIKTRFSQNWYKSAREFAEDVRLVFRNAMTYNPKGQDVHTMAEELSKIFEERWASIEKEYFPYQMYYDAGLPIPTPRKAPSQPPPPILAPITIPVRPAYPQSTLDRSESRTLPVDLRPKPPNSNFPHGVRTPVPKKPKAKDPNKRDMTYEEKQRLSTNLQSLPSEKLDAIVQIIKKRNSTLSQHDDEIEVDIDSVDAETLWELDRFVTNYKKSLSKNKRKAELALQARAAAAPMMNTSQAVVGAHKENTTGENISSRMVQVENQGDNASASSSSSSSSSDSGSSSSDSDSDSSSAYESDAGHSPRT